MRATKRTQAQRSSVPTPRALRRLDTALPPRAPTTSSQPVVRVLTAHPRALLIPCVSAILIAGLTGCTVSGPNSGSGPSASSSKSPSSSSSPPGVNRAAQTVSKPDVEQEIRAKMTDPSGRQPDSVTCPSDLQASVGAAIDCEMVVGAEGIGVKVTVTSVQGDNVDFDMDWSVDRNDVAKTISEQLGQQTGRKIDSVSCPTNLKAAVGAMLRCELTDAGQTYGVTATVTSVEGSLVKYNFTVDDRPK